MQSSPDDANDESSNSLITEVLQRHAAEKSALKQRHDKTRSGIPKKDRVGRQRFLEDARDEVEKMQRRHQAELKSSGFDLDDISKEMERLAISSSSNSTAGADAQPPNGRTESKAARRRRRKAEQEAASNRRIEEEKMAMGPSEKGKELNAINDQLSPQHLRIHTIAADGHCLYRAVAHQMIQVNLVSSVPPTVDGLRHATADFLLDHQDEYMPFIESVEGDASRYHQYCEDVRSTATWGGHIELQALSKLLPAIIEVYAADMQVLRIGSDNTSGRRKVLRVSFHRKFIHLGEHYNSVIPKDSEGR